MFKTLFALPQLGSELHGHMYAVGGECGLPHDHVKHRRWLAGTHSTLLTPAMSDVRQYLDTAPSNQKASVIMVCRVALPRAREVGGEKKVSTTVNDASIHFSSWRYYYLIYAQVAPRSFECISPPMSGSSHSFLYMNSRTWQLSVFDPRTGSGDPREWIRYAVRCPMTSGLGTLVDQQGSRRIVRWHVSHACFRRNHWRTAFRYFFYLRFCCRYHWIIVVDGPKGQSGNFWLHLSTNANPGDMQRGCTSLKRPLLMKLIIT
jgi:hypothetical protein